MVRRTLLMLALAACSETHEARDERRAEDSEAGEAGADDAADEQSGPAAAEDRAPDRDSASDAPSADVDLDAGVGMSPDPVHPAEDASCPAHAVDVRGESQFGPLQVTEVSVEYWGGFTMGTTLHVRGTAGGRALEIRTRVYTITHADIAAPTGEYRTSQDPARAGDMSVYARFCDDPHTHCAGSANTELRHAVLRVDTHEIPQAVMVNTPVRFEGRLSIADPGWSLDLPFALRWACGTSVVF